MVSFVDGLRRQLTSKRHKDIPPLPADTESTVQFQSTHTQTLTMTENNSTVDYIDRFIQQKYTPVFTKTKLPGIELHPLDGTKAIHFPAKVFQQILEYCAVRSLLNMQLARKDFRMHAGRLLWRNVIVMACDEFYRRPLMGLNVGYDRNYPTPRNIQPGSPVMTIDWSSLSEFFSMLETSDFGPWVHNIVICLAYRSPGPTALEPDVVPTTTHVNGPTVDLSITHFMRFIMPKRLKNLHSITIDSGFWTTIYPDYKSPDRELKDPSTVITRYKWDAVLANMFQYFPSASKQVHLREHWLSPKPVIVTAPNIKMLSIFIGQDHSAQFLRTKLPSSLERLDLNYAKKGQLNARSLKTVLSECRRLRMLYLECKNTLVNTPNTDWLPPSVQEFSRNFSESGTEARYYVKHDQIKYMHVHLRHHMHPAAAMYYKHITNLTKLHVIGPTKIDFNHHGLYEGCPNIRQLHVENMDTDYIAIMCMKFPLESLIIERICCEEELNHAGYPGSVRKLSNEYYNRLFAIEFRDFTKLKSFYFEISPQVQVQDITEWALQKFGDGSVSVIAGNRVMDLDVKRYQYVESPWRPVPMGIIYDGFMNLHNATMHKLALFDDFPEYL